jgi:hypothetical protein
MYRISKDRHASRIRLDSLSIVNRDVNALADTQKAGAFATLGEGISIRFHRTEKIHESPRKQGYFAYIGKK